MRTWRFPLLLVLALMTLGAVVYSSAQQGDSTCPVLIERAIAAVGDNCGGLDRNSACYGFRDVNATFTEPIDADFFTQPRDRAEVVTLRNIGTSPLNVTENEWGIALLSLQANLPDTLPGQNAIFMLLGDTEVESAVSPDDAFAGGAPVEVTTNAAASLFFYLDKNAQIVGRIPANTALLADAIDETGEWLRVVYEQTPGWVSRAALDPQAALDTLPVMTPESRTPMQSFYLRTGITGTQCSDAPDALVVQGPQNLTIDINADGADIRLGSTIALRVIPASPELWALFTPYYAGANQVTHFLELVVIDGRAILDPRTPDELIVEAGYRTLRCLSNPENLGLDTIKNDREVFAACPWLPPTNWRSADLDYYSALQGITLNYPIDLPLVPTPTPSPRPYIPPPPTRTPTLAPTEEITPEVTPTPTECVDEDEGSPCEPEDEPVCWYPPEGDPLCWEPREGDEDPVCWYESDELICCYAGEGGEPTCWYPEPEAPTPTPTEEERTDEPPDGRDGG